MIYVDEMVRKQTWQFPEEKKYHASSYTPHSHVHTATTAEEMHTYKPTFI